MKTKKKIFVRVSLVLGVLVLLYILMSVILSVKSAKIIDSCWENGGVLPEELEGIISGKDYYYMYPWIYDDKVYEKGDIFIDEMIGDIQKTHTTPLTLYKINSAVTYYEYCLVIRSNDGIFIGGSYSHCKVYWELKNGKWTVVGYWQHV